LSDAGGSATKGGCGSTFLGSAPFLTGATVSVVVGLWIGVGVKRWRREAYAVGVVMIGEVVLENGLKLIFARPRPPAFFGADPASFSFPSGHALASMCFYGVVAILAARHASTRGRSAATWMAAGLVIVLVGVSRIYIGMHYPSDVLAGYLIGLAWLGALRATGAYLPPMEHSVRTVAVAP